MTEELEDPYLAPYVPEIMAVPPGDGTAVWPFPHSAPVQACRQIVERACRDLHMTPDAIEDARVIVSELATNAVRHGLPPHELRMRRWRQRLVLEVVDGLVKPLHFPGTEPPLLVQGMFAPTGGRGLWVVSQLAQGHCGAKTTVTLATDPPQDAKSVWAAIPYEPGR